MLYFHDSLYLEVTSAVLGLTSTVLDTRQRILARPMSLASISMGLIVYFQSRLYAKCLLNLIYIVVNSYGWYRWKYGGNTKTGLLVSRMSQQNMVLLIFLGWGMAGLSGYLLRSYTKADLAYWDAVNAIFCIIAYILLVNKKLESWILWFILDIYFTLLCYYKGLYAFSISHGIYTVLAIYGYQSWYISYRRQQSLIMANGM